MNSNAISYNEFPDALINSPFVEHTNESEMKRKERNVSNNSFTILQLILIFIGVYFNCEWLKLSQYIESSHYSETTVGLYAYDLFFTFLITLPLIKLTNIESSYFNSYLYFIMCNIGGLGFALLGEVSYLENIVIVKDFWKHLTPKAIATFIIFGAIIAGVTIREIISSYREKTFRKQLVTILLFIIFYGGIFFLLKNGGANNIHWHVHHAIFAGFLSLFFTNWENKIEMILHAIMMGVVVEGINFFGLQELYLFLSQSGMPVKLPYAVFITFAYTFGLIIFKICTRNY